MAEQTKSGFKPDGAKIIDPDSPLSLPNRIKARELRRLVEKDGTLEERALRLGVDLEAMRKLDEE